ncbi:MAG: hypothetical protein OXH08_09095 [Gammaproteobacteria bacterium]|nr:hypothetical protein [Gammaproteobacteria bacterium]MDE0073375.1 hypothetical protein [Gammaproteobacteria bacterium]MDE0259407.1 hypothetical protein [Gammaproteobacteria bacterium]MXW10358.1 hypothetical protein [Gammaproteobacteria bacterium]MYC52091.1 hypothetical protein [Gammaproteobacteria bacterium]
MAASIEDAHRRLSRKVMGRPGVVGTAIGVAAGKPCIKVYLASGPGGEKARIPGSYGGYRVVIEKTGTIRRLSS